MYICLNAGGMNSFSMQDVHEAPGLQNHAQTELTSPCPHSSTLNTQTLDLNTSKPFKASSFLLWLLLLHLLKRS